MQRRADASFAAKPADFDTTSIASVSESSHWSGGAADDLDNVALVNGSDANPMENKDWSSYLRMAKNGYNSSDQGDDDDDDEPAQKHDEANSSNDELSDDDDDLPTSKKCYDSDEQVDDDDSYNTDEDLDDDDIWTIKPKLYSYYEKQFRTMQPDLNGFIVGSVAKPFFERSKLPLNELSKIWELSDVTKDGVLSFAEFCTAMHLVVLRVRNFDLPNELPAKLQPYAPLIDFNSETSLNRPWDASGDEPVHFGVKPQRDAALAHPVALRARPAVPEPPPRHSRSSSLGAVNHNNTSIPPPPLSQPSSTHTQVNNTPRIFQQQPTVPPRITSPISVTQDKPPPPPPPLPQSYHQSRILNFHISKQNSACQTVSNIGDADLVKCVQELVERMNKLSAERTARLSENSGISNRGKEGAEGQSEQLVESIRHHTEQNQMLRRVFNELERELRMLTDQRVALEIKMDCLSSKSGGCMTSSASTPAISQATPQVVSSVKQLAVKAGGVVVTPVSVQPAATSPVSVNVNSSSQMSSQLVSNKLNI